LSNDRSESGTYRSWKDIDECESCWQDEHTIRAVKMKDYHRDRKMLCYGCFVTSKLAGEIDPTDERIENGAVN